MTPTIPHALLQQAAAQPTADAYVSKVAGRWQATTWRTFADQVRSAAKGLIQLGFERGGVVAILGFNRPEWVILDHAAMMAGGAVAGIYTTCSREEVEYIVGHCEARVLLVENAAQLAKVAARKPRLPALQTVVLMRGADVPADQLGPDVITWDELLARGEATPQSTLDDRLAQLQPADLATLIYTSGTTGPPKGVMLSHDNLAWTTRLMLDIGGVPRLPEHADASGTPRDVSLSYLPLSHIAEQMATVLLPALSGSTVWFAESIEAVASNLKDCRPTVFFGVPRIWEKLHGGVGAKLAEVTGVKAKLVSWARGVCGQVQALHDREQPIPRLLAAQYALAQRAVITKLKQALGLDRARALISGAAPIAPEVLTFFASLDLPIREIYGQSEGTGPTSYNLPGRTRIGTVGPPLPGIECKLGPDDEVLVRGRNICLGYYKDPAASAETFEDGWMHSGDLGAFDADGFLTITGRKKDILITSGGKNIAPKNLEAAIGQSPVVADCVVIGDRRNYLTALVTLDEPAARAHLGAAAEGLDRAALAATPAVRAEIQRAVDALNATVAPVQQIKKFTVLGAPFGIDTGEYTPTLKIKRAVVATLHARAIEAMYAAAEGAR